MNIGNIEATNFYLGADQVEKIYLGDNVVWPTTPPEPVYSIMPLTIEAQESGTFYVNNSGVNYSVNGGTWSTTTGATEIQLSLGDTVRFFNRDTDDTATFSGNTINFKMYGNLESMEYGNNFTGQTSVMRENSAFAYYFCDCTGLTNVDNLILASSLKSSCYAFLFKGCTSLVKAPELPALTMTQYCYRQMFDGCTNLNYIKCLATNMTPYDQYTYNWVNGVQTTSGLFVKHPDATGWPQNKKGIPAGWTVQDAII